MSFSLASSPTTLCDSNCPGVIVASGVIGEETAAEFRDFVRRSALTPTRPVMMYLDSPGGNVAGALELGLEFRKLRVAAIVGRYAPSGGVSGSVGGECESACVYAWMGAVRRVATTTSRVALHRMSMTAESGRRDLADRRLVATVARYAARMGVSPRIVLLAESLSVDQTRALTPAEMLRARLATSIF